MPWWCYSGRYYVYFNIKKVYYIFINIKKTLKCCCTSRVPNLPIGRQMTSCGDIIPWRHDVMTSYHEVTYIIMSHHTPAFCILALKPENHRHRVFWPGDLDLWPMTLTIEVVRDFIKVNLFVEFGEHTSIRSAVRVFTKWHTHTQTDRRLRFYNLDRWRGR